MPIPTPFHARTFALCKSLLIKDWAGYYAVRSYDTYVEREYFAIRHAAGMVDVTPLYKYEVHGADAAEFLARIMVRNIKKLKLGQVFYCCWCDDEGKVVDDGTVARLDDTYFRVTAAEPNLHWLQRFARGYEVTITDSSTQFGALSVQGPNSRSILDEVTGGDVNELKYFWVKPAKIAGVEVHVSRTGYTGDLGYEVWVKNDSALVVYDAILGAGREYGLEPAGLDAQDITRIEAGYILNGIDYFNANHCAIEKRKSTPYEIGLGWMVRLKRARFNGQAALREEKIHGSKRVLVGLEIDWDEHERLFAAEGLPPEIAAGAWRDSVPVYDDTGRQVGYATSGAWSPTLKRNLALATVAPEFEAIGSRLQFEVTVEYRRCRVPATVVEKPFFDPERKRS